MSDDLVLDIIMDTQTDSIPSETHQQEPSSIDTDLVPDSNTNNPTNDSTLPMSPDSLSKKDKSTDSTKKEKGKKKKEKDEKEKKKKDSKDATNEETDIEKEKNNHEHDTDADDKTDTNEEATSEKKEGKKKKNKENKSDKSNLDPSSQTIEYVSTSGHHYELIKVQPKGKYDVKMHMTNERTFFKYLFASFHLGAMGTFLLQYYSQPSFYKPVLIGFIWLTAFSFVCVGLYTYYQRRQFLQQGKMKHIDGLQMHSPTYILLFFFLVFITILLYSVENLPTNKAKMQLDGSSSYAQQQTNTPTPFTTLLPVG